MKWKTGCKSILFIFMLIWVVQYFCTHESELSIFKNISYHNLVNLFLLSFFYLYCQGVIFNRALAAFNIRLSSKEAFGLTIITILGNYIFPYMGLGYRAKYLKEKYALAYSNFSISIIAIFFVEMFVFALGGMISCSYLYFFNYQIPIMLLVFFITFFIFLYLLIFFQITIKSDNKILKKFQDYLDKWYCVSRNRKLLKDIFLYTFLLYVVTCVMFGYCYVSLNIRLPIVTWLIPASLSDLSFLIRFTPGSFGTFDGSIIYSSMILGLKFSQGALVAGLVRLSTLFWIIVLSPILIMLFFRDYFTQV